jgi:hypothetical protein
LAPMTPLDKTLKRSLNIEGIDYVVTISPKSLKVTRKGRRLGIELKWADLTSGESALAVALHASVGRFDSVAPPAKLKALPNESAAVMKATPARIRRATRGAPTKRAR